MVYKDIFVISFSVFFFWYNFYPTALKGFGVLFSPMASGWAGYISETVKCKKFIFGRDIG